MAGLPEEVILRATEILDSLSTNRKKTSDIKKYNKNKIKQSFEESIQKEVISELKKLDINSLSPIESLKKLDELKNKL